MTRKSLTPHILAIILALGLPLASALAAEITIGTGTGTWFMPLGAYLDDSRTQTIYLVSEIGITAQFKGLSIYVTAVPPVALSNFTIRLKHTSIASYSTASWEGPSSGWTTVYQQDVTITTTGWQYFDFLAGFQYNGFDNLMVDISFNNSGAGANNGSCQYSLLGGNRTIFARANSDFGDPLDWTGTSSPSPNLSVNAPNLKLRFDVTYDDGDGLPDWWENLYNCMDPYLPDAAADYDDDGLNNQGEYDNLTDPCTADSDGDGMPDGWEVAQSLDPLVNDALLDADADGLNNLGEYTAGTDPHNVDTDNDTLADGYEVTNELDPLLEDAGGDKDGDGLTNLQEFILGTRANLSDTDGDLMPDGWEVTQGFNPLFNDGAADADSDGLGNAGEYAAGTNPHDVDTDDDTMPDGYEVQNGLNPLAEDTSGDLDGDGLTNLIEFALGTRPNLSDTDGDGMPDGWEVAQGFNPLVDDGAADADSDGISNAGEYAAGTDPQDIDTDGDSMTDGYEMRYVCLDPLVGDSLLDDDSDGINNITEFRLSTDPCEGDADGDAMPDIYEFLHACLNVNVPDGGVDYDSDSLTSLEEYQYSADLDACEADTDADGVNDGIELQYGSNPISSTVTPGYRKSGADLRVSQVASGWPLPSLVFSGSEFGVSWNAEPSGYEIIFARISASGTTIQSDVRITSTFNNTTYPSLVFTGSEFGVSWDDYRDYNHEIYFARVSNNGIKIGSDIRITTSDQTSREPSLVYSGSEYGVSWTEDRDGNYEIYFARISVEGTKIGSDVRITNDSHASRNSSMVFTGSEFGVCWWDTRDGNNEIYFCRISTAGAKIDSDLRITTNASESKYPSLVYTGSEFGVSWNDQRDGHREIYFTRISSTGAKIGSESKISSNAYNGLEPSLVWTGSEYGVAWTDNFADIYFSRCSVAGTRIGVDVRITAHLSNTYSPSLAFTGSEFGVSWLGNSVEFARIGLNDLDGDGLSEDEENIWATNPADWDTDDDQVSDGWEAINSSCLDPLVGDSELDPDGDELTNLDEYGLGTNPCDSDSDHDGLSDLSEINIYQTDPLWWDTDADLLSDGEEVLVYGSDPLVMDTDADGLDDRSEAISFRTNPLLPDSDGDGLGDYLEAITKPCLDPNNNDSDNDGLIDGTAAGEDKDSDGVIDPGETNPCSADSDNDGLNDGLEVNTYFTNPLNRDTDGDSLKDGDEVNIYGTNPLSTDTDGDGMIDSHEVSHSCLNPFIGDSLLDFDADGINNITEVGLGTNACNEDTDGDGLSDGQEVMTYATNPLDPDTDDDALNDGQEINTYGTNPLDYDTDDGGETDGAEILNSRDPLNPTDDYFLYTVTIGTTSIYWDLPFATDYGGARTQTIYLASEIGRAGAIISMALDVTAIPKRVMENFTIRLKHTPLSYYATAAWDTGWTVVYQNNEPQGATGWRTFTFTTPFVYNGTDNLMVDISFINHDSYFSGSGFCRCSRPGGYRTVYCRSFIDESDPLIWSGTSDPIPSSEENVPNIRLSIPIQASFPDADGDGLSNDFETFLGTNLNSPDTDGDSLPDAWEVGYSSCVNPLEGDPLNDPDGDGISNRNEYLLGLNPCSSDSDHDGLSDNFEIDIYGSDPLLADTDGDGLSDGNEVLVYGTAPLLADTDGDDLNDGPEVNLYHTSPLLIDTDEDGMSDGYEVLRPCLNPLVGDNLLDSDADGLNNITEFTLGTDACLADTDGDWLMDGQEVLVYFTNPLDFDTDDSGEPDGREIQYNRDPLNPTDDNFYTSVTIGAGTGSWEYPLSALFSDVRTQTIYLASEIGQAGTIASLALDITTIPGPVMNNFTIRLKHTNQSSYTTAAFESGWTVVYQNNEPQGVTGWRTFTFTTSFVYNGTDNLMVDISFNNSSSSSSGYCRYSWYGNYRTVYYRINGNRGDPLYWFGTSNPAPSSHIYVPNIRLGFLVQISPPDADGDGLSDDLEAFLGTNPNLADTDGDGLTDFAEVITLHTSAMSWDTDGDALPDGYEAGRMGSAPPLNPLDAEDGGANFDGDENTNAHEYWNGADPWTLEPTGGAGCFYWGDAGAGDGVVGPSDAIELKKAIIGIPANYSGVIPNTGETQDLSMDGSVGPSDFIVIQQMILSMPLPTLPSRPVALEVIESPGAPVLVGNTCHVTVAVRNEAGLYTPGIGVVFEMVAGPGTATLLGGEGAAAPGARYDISGSVAGPAGRARIVLRVDSPGAITLHARIPVCGAMPNGRSSAETVLNPAAVIIGE